MILYLVIIYCYFLAIAVLFVSKLIFSLIATHINFLMVEMDWLKLKGVILKCSPL